MEKEGGQQRTDVGREEGWQVVGEEVVSQVERAQGCGGKEGKYQFSRGGNASDGANCEKK